MIVTTHWKNTKGGQNQPWTKHLTNYDNVWWSFKVWLESSHWDLFNGTGCVENEASMCPWWPILSWPLDLESHFLTIDLHKILDWRFMHVNWIVRDTVFETTVISNNDYVQPLIVMLEERRWRYKNKLFFKIILN